MLAFVGEVNGWLLNCQHDQLYMYLQKIMSHFRLEVHTDTAKNEFCNICSSPTNPAECGSALPQ